MQTLLLVDDDEDIRVLARACLEPFGRFDVVSVASGEEALERASRQPPDVVLMDLRMPGLGGAETLRRLRAEPGCAVVPVILMTAGARADRQRSCRELGALGLIDKPFAPETLHQQVVDLLDGASDEDRATR